MYYQWNTGQILCNVPKFKYFGTILTNANFKSEELEEQIPFSE
jgi:hypothetical protein